MIKFHFKGQQVPEYMERSIPRTNMFFGYWFALSYKYKGTIWLVGVVPIGKALIVVPNPPPGDLQIIGGPTHLITNFWLWLIGIHR